LFIERFIGEQARLAFVQNGNLRVEAKLVKMFAHELETKPCSVPMCAASKRASCSAKMNRDFPAIFFRARREGAGAFPSRRLR
jgi:hypothetical protein